MTTSYYRITADISVSSLVATITPSEIIPVDTDGEDETAISSLYSVIATGGDIKGNDCSGIINSISSAGVITTAATWYGSDATDAVLTVQNIPRGTALSQSTNEAIATFNNNETAISECVRALDDTSVANAFLSLDGQINAYVLGVGTTTPPTSPSEGDAYVTGTSSTGIWSGYDNYFAYYINGAYVFKAPYLGMSVYNSVDGETYTYDGSEWSESTLPDSGVTAGTYKSVTVTNKGIVSSGTNPTTLSGYGITDAVYTDGSVSFSGEYSATIDVSGAYTWTLPAQSGTLAELNLSQTWTAEQDFNAGITVSGTSTNLIRVTPSDDDDGAEVYGTNAANTIVNWIINKDGSILTGSGSTSNFGEISTTDYTLNVTGTFNVTDAATLNGGLTANGGDFEINDDGTEDTDAVRMFSNSGNLYLQAGDGNYIYYRNTTGGLVGIYDTANNYFGIGETTPEYPIDVNYSGDAAGIRIYNSGSESSSTAALWLETAAMSNAWQIKAGNSNVLTFGIANVADYIRIDSSYEIYPVTANSGSVGTTSYPFANGYFENGVTTTSDEQLKRNKSFVTDNDALLAVGRDMAKHISYYQMLAAVSQKGDAARYHFGVSSQDAMAAFTAAGLDWKRYGIVCARTLDKDYLAPDGKTVLLKAGATTYYVRQEEADKLIMAALVDKLFKNNED